MSALETLAKYDDAIRATAYRLRAPATQTGVLDPEDLVSVGKMAVLEALERYEDAAPVSESTFVKTRIRQRMVDEIRRVHPLTRDDVAVLKREPDSDRAKILGWRTKPGLLEDVRIGTAPDLDGMEWPQVEILLRTLTKARRRAVIERILQERKHGEIARALLVSESRACQQYQAGMAELRKRMQTLLPRRSVRTLERTFLANIERSGTCWLWREDAPKRRQVYIGWRHCMTATHLAWLLRHGKSAPGRCLKPRCGSPRCVNPEHLVIEGANRGKVLRRKPAEERFWARVDRTGECWTWRGRMAHGYGCINLNDAARTRVLVHRYAWQLRYGELDPRVRLSRACGNPRCVRPEHMRAQTTDERLRWLSRGAA